MTSRAFHTRHETSPDRRAEPTVLAAFDRMQKARRGRTYHRRDIDFVSIGCSDETWIFFGAVILGRHMGITALVQHCDIDDEEPQLLSTKRKHVHRLCVSHTEPDFVLDSKSVDNRFRNYGALFR